MSLSTHRMCPTADGALKLADVHGQPLGFGEGTRVLAARREIRERSGADGRRGLPLVAGTGANRLARC